MSDRKPPDERETESEVNPPAGFSQSDRTPPKMEVRPPKFDRVSKRDRTPPKMEARPPKFDRVSKRGGKKGKGGKKKAGKKR